VTALTVTPNEQVLPDRRRKRQTPYLWLKRGSCAVLLLGGGALFLLLTACGLAEQPAKPQAAGKVVEAEKFVLRDAEGKVRAELGFRDGEPGLVLRDGQGKPRTRLAVLADGSSSITLYDKEGTGRAVLRVKPDGEPQVDFQDKHGKVRAGLPRVSTSSSEHPVRPAASVTSEPDEAFRKAEGLYQNLCLTCHGKDGRGTRARGSLASLPDFTNAKWQASRTDAQFVASILDGRGEEMLAFNNKVTPSQARDLVRYIRAFNPDKTRPVEAPVSDFESRYRQLQQQWEELEKQMRELSSSPRKQ